MDDNKLELLKKFPAFIKKALSDGMFNIPDEALFEYVAFEAYRCISRDNEDNTPLNMDDMKSYAEMGKKYRAAANPLNKAKFYGISLYENKQDLDNTLSLPKPGKKIAKGLIYQEGGPHLPKDPNKDSHVTWWLYENADLSSFKIIGEKNGTGKVL